MRLAEKLNKLGIIKKGNFTLKSGKDSNYYIDVKKTFGNPKVFNLICDEFCKVLDKGATCVVGSGHGGIPLATAVSIKLKLPLVLVRDKTKQHGLKKMIDGYIPTKKDRIVIIDDVFTTGTCVANIVKILRKTKSKILGVYVVVSRGEPLKLKVPIKNLLTLKELTK